MGNNYRYQSQSWSTSPNALLLPISPIPHRKMGKEVLVSIMMDLLESKTVAFATVSTSHSAGFHRQVRSSMLSFLALLQVRQVQVLYFDDSIFTNASRLALWSRLTWHPVHWAFSVVQYRGVHVTSWLGCGIDSIRGDRKRASSKGETGH